jgi:hypothetical protein
MKEVAESLLQIEQDLEQVIGPTQEQRQPQAVGMTTGSAQGVVRSRFLRRIWSSVRPGLPRIDELLLDVSAGHRGLHWKVLPDTQWRSGRTLIGTDAVVTVLAHGRPTSSSPLEYLTALSPVCLGKTTFQRRFQSSTTARVNERRTSTTTECQPIGPAVA